MHRHRHQLRTRKDGLPAAAMRIRVRIRGGNLEPVEKLDLPEGKEITAILDVSKERETYKRNEVPVFADMRLLDPFPLTRRKIYEDL